ncbi:MAG: 4Fe-4S dicluster domain-containing protein [Terracidiphilus sp.]
MPTPRQTIPGTRYHRIRKTIQTICVSIFILLPLFDIMRVDIVRQRFYFFGAELWISEFAIMFLTMMFVWILVAAMAMIYGRFWCGYLCPQMIFSEASVASEQFISRWVKKHLTFSSERTRKVIARAAFYLLGVPPSIFFAFVFVSYFVPPADLFHRLMSLDLRTAGGIVGASITAITFFDFAFLRQGFCISICPYGYLQNMLADKHTLLVHFHDPNHQCINCAKCVKACPMGIDIRKGTHQLECTHCAECVDACSTVLGKINRVTVINYGWGDSAGNAEEDRKWYRRIGLRDGKRIVILALLTIYAIGLSVVISLREPVMVRIMPNRMTLYTLSADGLVHNQFRVVVSNRSHTQKHLTLALDGLPQGRILDADAPLLLAPGQTVQSEFDVVAPAGALQPGVNHMRILASVPAQKTGAFDETFIAPMDSAPAPKSAREQPQGKD